MKYINDKFNNPNIQTVEITGNCALKINGKNYYSLDGITNVVVGTENKTIGKEVYASKKYIPNNWFILDLETGKRNIYPGCILTGKTQYTPTTTRIKMHEQMNDSSPVVIELLTEGLEVRLLNRFTYDENPFWYQCQYITNIATYEGFIRKEFITNLQYR